jgi:putative DeoR family transcriptional regulator (stage III sporulation protein D)
MKDYIEQRVLDIASFLAGSGSTVRDAARKFHVSKSTVHKDMMDRLPFLHSELARSVRHVLDVNKAERHLRGGQATCMKYKRKKPELKAGFSASSEK